jgi:glutamate transport system permease protein
MLPAIVSQLVIILKESSLGFVVGYLELSRDGRTAVEYLGEAYSIPVYTCIAVIYIVAGLLLSRLANWLSGRTARRYGRMAATPSPAKELASV